MFQTIVPDRWDMAPMYYEQRLEFDISLHCLLWMQGDIPTLKSGSFKQCSVLLILENL